MEAEVAKAIAIEPGASGLERTVDITTTGRRTGEPRRLEIWFYRVDGTVYLTGSPGRRDWTANLLAEPAFTFHLRGAVEADLPAHATPIVDDGERRRVLGVVAAELQDIASRPPDPEAMVAGAPLFEVHFDE